jgi:two-component system cell cycle sensor histidine kinase/response regulator CckA
MFDRAGRWADVVCLLTVLTVGGLWALGCQLPGGPFAFAVAGGAVTVLAVRRWPTPVPQPLPAPVADRPTSVAGGPSESVDEAARQAQKMEAVGRLAGGIAHDFNNILTVINGCSEVLLLTDRPGAERELIQEIKKAGERGAALTRQLADFSRKKPAEPKLVDLGGLVCGMETMLQRLVREDIRLVLHPHPVRLPILADPGQVEQVVMNLVINARDAMPAGGTITVATDCVAAGGVLHALLKVTDTGVGMDKATKARIFEPFFTTKAAGKGTGLGLATVYGIVQQTGGRIDVFSAPGKGATFRIRLPLAEEGALAPTESPPSEAAATADPDRPVDRGTVLLVEDEGGVRAMVRRALLSAGYTVVEARDGLEAIVRSHTHRGPIDLVLTDVVMPRLGGAELVPILKRRHPRMRTVFMSGYTQSVMMTQGVDEDAPCMIKPFSADDVTRTVRAVLAGEAAAGATGA